MITFDFYYELASSVESSCYGTPFELNTTQKNQSNNMRILKIYTHNLKKMENFNKSNQIYHESYSENRKQQHLHETKKEEKKRKKKHREKYQMLMNYDIQVHQSNAITFD